MIPPKLEEGDEVRVIAPSKSLHIISDDNRKKAEENLQRLGLKLTFGDHVEEFNELDLSSSIQSRLEDLHDAFKDDSVKAILTVIGGFNANHLLDEIDYELIRNNPKILCGYSDITILQNAIYEKTGLVTYSGPHYSTFANPEGLDYILSHFKKCLMRDKPFKPKISAEWNDDPEWYMHLDDIETKPNPSPRVFNQGKAEGEIIGGNLGTLNLLFGTEYMPELEDKILFLEDCRTSGEKTHFEVDRLLHSLTQQPGFEKVKGLVLGRFEDGTGITQERLDHILETKKLGDLPVVTGMDFGHTYPMFTFPIGGTARLTASDEVNLEILEH